MKPKKILIDYAQKSGRMDRVNQLLSLAYTNISTAFLLYDEADELMKECGLKIGRSKLLASRLSDVFDTYLKDFSEMIVDAEEKRRYFADLDEFRRKVFEWAGLSENFTPEKVTLKDLKDEP